MSEEMCDCFNQYGLEKLSPSVKQTIDKIVTAKLQSLDELSKVISLKEAESLTNEMEKFDKNSEYQSCLARVTSKEGMSKYMTDLTELLGEYKNDERAFQNDFEKEIIKAMKANKNCKTFYYLFILGMQSNTKSDK